MTTALDPTQHDIFLSSFKFSPIGMALISMHGRFLDANPTLCRITGFTKEELLAATLGGISFQEDIPAIESVRNQLLRETMGSRQLRLRIIRKNDSCMQLSATFSVARDESKKSLFFILQLVEEATIPNIEQELKLNSQQLESFIQHNADAMWIVDTEDNIVDVNPAFETLFGWSLDEVLGRKLPIIPSSLKVSMEEIHQRIKKGETIVGLETTRLCKNGQLLDVEATLSPLKGYSGTIIGITGVCRDVTRRKRAEQELLAKTQQLESFIQHNADAMWIVDTEDNIIDVNHAFETLFGWSLDEVRGRKLPIIPSSLKVSMEKIHRRIKQGETVVSLETNRVCKDNRLIYVEATLSPLKNHAGVIIGITGICRDVTRRKRAEQELYAKTQLLESFLEHHADAIVVFNKKGLVERVNGAFEKVIGWSKEEVIGKDLYSLPFIPDEFHAEARHLFQQLDKGEPIIGYQTIRKKKSGEHLNIMLTASPILDSEGIKAGWSVSMRDITEWKLAQEHLQNSEKLSVAGQLAAGIAHEIRNPITAIKGFIQLMKSGLTQKQKYYDIITSEIERIELIVSELLILAKPQAVHYQRKDIWVLLTEVMTLLDSQALLYNVQFSTKFKPGATYLYCDENQLKQVFINFIKNSIDAMPKGGKITIEVEGKGQEIQVRLTDQGFGIPKELLSKLGQPFYTTKEKGTGLGFMISKKIIENHSGRLEVWSEVDNGTTITITLPLCTCS